MMDKCQGGRSIFELMVVVALLAILSVSALPRVIGLLDRVTVRSVRHALLQDIRTVRYAAIEHRRPAYLCALNTTGDCVRSSRWVNGWMGFVDINRDGRFDRLYDKLLLRHGGLVDKPRVAVFMHARWRDIKFDARGVLRRSGYLLVCNPSLQLEQNIKLIRMNTFGRLAVETGKTNCE